MNELPYFENLPIPYKKKNQIAYMVSILEKDNDILFNQIINEPNIEPWKVVDEIKIEQNIGRLIAAILFFKKMNMNKENTLRLYNKYIHVIMNSDLTIFQKQIKLPYKLYVILLIIPMLYLLCSCKGSLF